MRVNSTSDFNNKPKVHIGLDPENCFRELTKYNDEIWQRNPLPDNVLFLDEFATFLHEHNETEFWPSEINGVTELPSKTRIKETLLIHYAAHTSYKALTPIQQQTRVMLYRIYAVMMGKVKDPGIRYHFEDQAITTVQYLVIGLANCADGMVERMDTIWNQWISMNTFWGALYELRVAIVESLAHRFLSDHRGILEVHIRDMYFEVASKINYGVNYSRNHGGTASVEIELAEKIRQEFLQCYTPILIVESIEINLSSQVAQMGKADASGHYSMSIAEQWVALLNHFFQFIGGNEKTILDYCLLEDECIRGIDWVKMRLIIENKLREEKVFNAEARITLDLTDQSKLNESEIKYLLKHLSDAEFIKAYVQLKNSQLKLAVLTDRIVQLLEEKKFPRKIDGQSEDALSEIEREADSLLFKMTCNSQPSSQQRAFLKYWLKTCDNTIFLEKYDQAHGIPLKIMMMSEKIKQITHEKLMIKEIVDRGCILFFHIISHLNFLPIEAEFLKVWLKSLDAVEFVSNLKEIKREAIIEKFLRERVKNFNATGDYEESTRLFYCFAFGVDASEADIRLSKKIEFQNKIRVENIDYVKIKRFFELDQAPHMQFSNIALKMENITEDELNTLMDRTEGLVGSDFTGCSFNSFSAATLLRLIDKSADLTGLVINELDFSSVSMEFLKKYFELKVFIHAGMNMKHWFEGDSFLVLIKKYGELFGRQKEIRGYKIACVIEEFLMSEIKNRLSQDDHVFFDDLKKNIIAFSRSKSIFPCDEYDYIKKMIFKMLCSKIMLISSSAEMIQFLQYLESTLKAFSEDRMEIKNAVQSTFVNLPRGIQAEWLFDIPLSYRNVSIDFSKVIVFFESYEEYISLKNKNNLLNFQNYIVEFKRCSLSQLDILRKENVSVSKIDLLDCSTGIRIMQCESFFKKRNNDNYFDEENKPNILCFENFNIADEDFPHASLSFLAQTFVFGVSGLEKFKLSLLPENILKEADFDFIKILVMQDANFTDFDISVILEKFSKTERRFYQFDFVMKLFKLFPDVANRIVNFSKFEVEDIKQIDGLLALSNLSGLKVADHVLELLTLRQLIDFLHKKSDIMPEKYFRMRPYVVLKNEAYCRKKSWSDITYDDFKDICKIPSMMTRNIFHLRCMRNELQDIFSSRNIFILRKLTIFPRAITFHAATSVEDRHLQVLEAMDPKLKKPLTFLSSEQEKFVIHVPECITLNRLHELDRSDQISLVGCSLAINRLKNDKLKIEALDILLYFISKYPDMNCFFSDRLCFVGTSFTISSLNGLRAISRSTERKMKFDFECETSFLLFIQLMKEFYLDESKVFYGLTNRQEKERFISSFSELVPSVNFDQIDLFLVKKEIQKLTPEIRHLVEAYLKNAIVKVKRKYNVGFFTRNPPIVDIMEKVLALVEKKESTIFSLCCLTSTVVS